MSYRVEIDLLVAVSQVRVYDNLQVHVYETTCTENSISDRCINLPVMNSFTKDYQSMGKCFRVFL